MTSILFLLLAELPDADAGDDWPQGLRIAVGIAVLVLIAWMGYSARRNKDDFRITVRGGRVEFRGRFPVGRRADTAGFLLNDIAPPGRIRVTGNWSAQRVLRITVHGSISQGECQRIRNFMKITLKG